MAPLDEYKRKRDFDRTPEPAGTEEAGEGPLRFVIHEHDATRLHYDLRLQVDGVLKSWAVPKGPSLDPADKRLAVETEDHPMSYFDFEGVIPEGQYGAGPVVVWDQGTWEPDGDPQEAYADGKLEFRLHGQKLAGAWRLVRTKTDWLLMKRNDAAAVRSPAVPIVDLSPHSVKTGRTLEEVARGKDPGPVVVPEVPRPPLPARVSRPPDEGDWLAEVRLKGQRLRVRRCGAEVTLLDSDGADCTERFPAVARAVARLPVRGLILDGVLSNDVYVAFDLLHHDGFDFTLLPTTDRKEALRNLLTSLPTGGVLRYGDHVRGRPADFFREACELKVPGVVYKRADARYGEQGDWRWLSCVRDVTSPGKLLWPDAGIDKRELAQAYAALADRMLPGLLRRPLTLVRCPEGIDGDCFFQKHDRPGMSEALGRVPMGEKQPYLMVLDRAGLVSLAQVAALELHVQGVRADDLRHPDLLVLDLDPAEDVPWARVAATALALRELLDALGLVPLLRVTGGKGLHVVAPLVPEATLEQVRDFTHAVAQRFARRDPKHYTAKLGLQHRPGRILIDWVRNAHKATAIATWSPRAKPGAPVAAPLDWSDLDPGASGPPFIGLRQALERPDPWPDLTQAARPLPAFPGAP